MIPDAGVFVRQPVVVTPDGEWLLGTFLCRTVPGVKWVGDDDVSARPHLDGQGQELVSHRSAGQLGLRPHERGGRGAASCWRFSAAAGPTSFTPPARQPKAGAGRAPSRRRFPTTTLRSRRHASPTDGSRSSTTMRAPPMRRNAGCRFTTRSRTRTGLRRLRRPRPRPHRLLGYAPRTPFARALHGRRPELGSAHRSGDRRRLLHDQQFRRPAEPRAFLSVRPPDAGRPPPCRFHVPSPRDPTHRAGPGVTMRGR